MDELLARMDALTQALHAQTAAMQELADSNRAVVDLLIAEEREEADEAPPDTYLDGTPMG